MATESHTSRGRIIFYDTERGYGYLRLHDSLEEFHFRERNLLDGPVEKGDLVSFTLRRNKQGYYADKVRYLLLT